MNKMDLFMYVHPCNVHANQEQNLDNNVGAASGHMRINVRAAITSYDYNQG